jgi:hypothetical protein
VFLGVSASPASASAEPECGSSCRPWWYLSSQALPASLPRGGEGEIMVVAEDLGDTGAAPGSTVTLTDRLPEGLEAKRVSGSSGPCEVRAGEAREVTCSVEGKEAALRAYGDFMVSITVAVSESAQPGANTMSISGGGAASVSSSSPIGVGGEPAFGVEQYEMRAENADGSLDTQAGSHPFQLTTTLALNQTADPGKPPAAVKDLRFKLPAGLIGNPTPFPQCPLAKFVNEEDGHNLCPDDTVVGVASATIALTLDGVSKAETEPVPLFNLTPSTGEPARFGFYYKQDPVYLDTSVRTGSDYGVTVTVPNITELASTLSSRVTFWGVPGDPRHDPVRGFNCLDPREREAIFAPCTATEQEAPPPLLALPTACEGPPHTSVEGDSWQDEGVFTAPLQYTFQDKFGNPVALDGCNQLPFDPSIKATPDGSAGSTPTGLNVDVHVDQEAILNGTSLAQSNVKDIIVAFPEGVILNPSAADGLQACSESQVGYLPGESRPPGELHFTPTVPGGTSALVHEETAPLEPGVNACPNAAKIATVKIRSPLLPPGHLVEGAMYLASPQNFHSFPAENPFQSLVAMYIVAEDPVSGTVVKLPGSVSLNQATGQITATFEDNPQLAFEDAEIHLLGGERAPLATPARCGTYTTDATFTPWSGNPPVTSSSSFQIDSGPNGSPCPGQSLPFAPSLASGSTNINAGAFSPLTTTLSRPSGDQNIQSVTLHYPAGLSGLLSGVKLCGEAEANAGTCGPESQIGETIVSVGEGSDPFTVTGGKVYITGPYRGAPFGLSIVNPAAAGPFDLQQGRPVIVRAKIEVNPTTAALTVTTDASGEHAIPTIIEGFQLQIQHVNVLINRPGFTFNPTDCDPAKVTGVINSAEGSSSPVEDVFQVTNCAALKFAPIITFSTNGNASKQSGASLITKVSYPSAAQGAYANIGSVKVELPKALPSRLTTLQRACLAKVFEASPAACPPESKIGYAVVHTPLLPVPLTGPAIFVSHGGEAFPSLTMVLQGYGVSVDLVGATFISKAGITSTTFKTVPDTPFSTFELVLPQGPYSALATNLPHESHDLCGQKLVIPTEFLSQAGGAPLKQEATVAVTGCPPAITVVSHKVKGKTATIQVSVPAAGKLVATGKGLSKASKTAKGATTLTVELPLTNAEAAFLGQHKPRKLKAKVNLQFTPQKGGKLKTTTTVLIG